MDEFYKNFKNHDSFNIEHETPVDAWGKFKKFRKPKDETWLNKVFGLWPLLIAGLLGLLMVTNLISLNNLNKLRKTEQILERDTIYITKYKERSLSEAPLSTIDSLTGSLIYLQKKIDQSELKIERLNTQLLTFENMQKELDDYQYQTSPRSSSFLSSSINDLDKANSLTLIPVEKDNRVGLISKEVLRPKINAASSLEQIVMQKLRHKRYLTIGYMEGSTYINNRNKLGFWESIMPKTFSVGIEGGGLIVPDYLSLRAGGYQFGFVVSTLLSNKIRGQFELINYKIKAKTEDDTNPEIPEIEGPEQSYLKEVYINQTGISALLGLEYIITNGKKLRTFSGISIGLSRDKNPQFKYEFVTPQGEVYVTPEDNQSGYHGLYRINGGIEYNIMRGGDLQFHVGYQRSFAKNSANNLYAKTRFLYHF